MLFSYKELKKMANLPSSITLEEVVNAINSIGFEVEETKEFGNVKGIKFGKILELYQNPNGDKLTVARIEFDDKERTIQTTANNLEIGNVVIAFVPGSSFNDIVFQEKEMKGIVSEGMLSSLNEFGVDKELIRGSHGDEIMIYDVEDLSIDPIEYLGLQDHIIDIDILSNRPDAHSYYVMGRELAAYFQTTFLWPVPKDSSITSSLNVENGEALGLAMIEASDAPRVSLREQIMLAKFGLKSINDIVDITNLTLIMTGQPTHAYDSSIVGNNFKSDNYSGELTILGDQKVLLDNDLVIMSNNEPVSVAGVIGLEKTGVKSDTKEFLLELGRFPIKSVRKAVKAVKLTNYSSSQSSKNISEGTMQLGVEYLMMKLNKFSNVVNLNVNEPKVVKYKPIETSKLAGFDITKNEKWKDTIKSLEILGFKFLDDEVVIPTYRHDVNTVQDLNEEIFRFFGYDSFEPVAPKIASTHINSYKDYKNDIAAMGYQEVTTYSLISEKKNIVNPFDLPEVVKLKTFVSKEREEIRSSQAFSLLEVIEYNQKRKIELLSIFSHGMIGTGVKTYALASTIKSFEDIKQDLVNILPDKVIFERIKNNSLHPGVSAKIMLKNKMIGWIGKVHPSLSKVNAYIAEVILDEPKYVSSVKGYSTDPLKSIDITFELKEKETIFEYIKDYEVYSSKVIDEFLIDGINKVTVNFKGTKEQIEILNKQFNK